MSAFLFYIIVHVSLVAFAFFFGVLWHELGHALPMLFMTRGRVVVYVGSLGNPNYSVKCRIGRLEMFLKCNPLLWRKGVCRPPAEALSINQRMLYTATGPLASLLLTIVCWRLLPPFNFFGYSWFAPAALLFASGIFTLSSIIPRIRPFAASDGQVKYNDADQLYRLFKLRKLPVEYLKATDCVLQKKYDEAAALLDTLIDSGNEAAIVYRLAVYAHIYSKNYIRARQVNERIRSAHGFNADDYANEGFINSRLKQYDAAIASYQNAIKLESNHIYALNNMGYALILSDQAAIAIPYFNRLIALSPKFAYAYNNRGWAKIKMGALEEGFKDVSYSLKLDNTNADAYKNIGLCYMKKMDFATAKTFLDKAKAMDPEVDFIDDYLSEVNNALD